MKTDVKIHTRSGMFATGTVNILDTDDIIDFLETYEKKIVRFEDGRGIYERDIVGVEPVGEKR